MNKPQVDALARLMTQARPHRRHADDPEPEINARISYVQGADDGNTAEITFFSNTNLLDKFPQAFYIKSDGDLYVYDSELDRQLAVWTTGWEDGPRPHERVLVAYTGRNRPT